MTTHDDDPRAGQPGGAPARRAMESYAKITTLKPLKDYHEDEGPVLWWALPLEEPPYVGSPIDSDWPGYHTHWSHLPDRRDLALTDGTPV